MLDTADTQNPLTQALSLSNDAGVLTITFANPPAHTLSRKTIDDLHATLKQAESDRSVAVIVLASTGNLFCAGHDLQEMRYHRDHDEDGGEAFLISLFDACSKMMKSIPELKKTVIAKVDGVATAAGCQLVAACDLAFCSDLSHFATPGVNIGGFCATPMVALSRNVSRKHAMQMLLTGEMIDAQSAMRMGLVNEVVSSRDLDKRVDHFAKLIASKSIAAIARGKRAFYQQAELSVAEAYQFGNQIMVDSFMKPDADEGVEAFFDKRKPNWPER